MSIYSVREHIATIAIYHSKTVWAKTKIVGVALLILTSVPAGSQTTSDFQNALTVCAAGSKLQIDADLKGRLASLYESETYVDGRASIDIEGLFLKTLPEGQKLAGYRIYVDCLKGILSKYTNARSYDEVLAEFNPNIPLSALVDAFGQPLTEHSYCMDGDELRIFKNIGIAGKCQTIREFKGSDISLLTLTGESNDIISFVVEVTSKSSYFIIPGIKIDTKEV